MQCQGGILSFTPYQNGQSNHNGKAGNKTDTAVNLFLIALLNGHNKTNSNG